MQAWRESAVACDTTHPHHEARRETRVRDPHHDDPVHYESRTDWQKALWKSGIDPDSKRYIKQLENLVTDNWTVTFEDLWKEVEQILNRGLPVTDDVLAEYIALSTRRQLRSLNRQQWDSAFNGLYVGAREQSYRPTGFGLKKRQRSAQVIDTIEEQAVLARLRETALQKVRSITDKELRQEILERLSEPGAYGRNPVALANEIIRQERRKLEDQIEDRKELRQQIQSLYDDQLWKVQRITRTEAANAYWLSQLTGYREQGVVQIKFNAHTYEQKTCAVCLALDGSIHDIDTLLSQGGRYPLSMLTHPQCRCWPTPVIQHVTLESMEQMYEQEPDLFAPGQTVFDQYALELEDVVKEYQSVYGTKVQDLPVEHEKDVKAALDVMRETPYQQLQPPKLRFVQDVGGTDEFRAAVPTPDPVLGQITAWTTPENETLISTFSADNGQTIEATLIREWAGRIYEQEQTVREHSDRLYGRAAEDVRPADLRGGTIEKLLGTFRPHTMMRQQLVGDVPTVALERRLRDASDEDAMDLLMNLGIDDRDVETIVQWRHDRPVWTLDGQYVPAEGTTGSGRNFFVNRVAEEGAREMFVEAVVSYVVDPWTLADRDPEQYAWLRENVLGGQEFKDE